MSIAFRSASLEERPALAGLNAYIVCFNLRVPEERSSRLKEPLLKAFNGPLDYYLYFPTMDILHTFIAGKPPRLWVNPYLGFSS